MEAYLYKFENKPLAVSGTRKDSNFRTATTAPNKAKLIVKDAQQQHRRQVTNNRRAIENKIARQKLRPEVPMAPYGMMFEPVALELYLEEITDRVIEMDVMTQTDLWVDSTLGDRSAASLTCASYVAAKIGQDAETQIEPGDLFNFDMEVRPILEVLIGKTLEQACLEVAQEEELASVRERLHAFQELCNADVAQLQRMEQEDLRWRAEREKRQEQTALRHRMEVETAHKLAVHAYALNYCQDLETAVFGELNCQGYFFDPVERVTVESYPLPHPPPPGISDVELGFIHHLESGVARGINNFCLSQALLDDIICQAMQMRKSSFGLFERGKAEWQVVDRIIDPVHVGAASLLLDDMELLIERVVQLAREATQRLMETVCQTAVKAAVEQFCLEEAAARTAAAAVDEASEEM